jgi:predicted RNA-binding Zn ribbon-like protein
VPLPPWVPEIETKPAPMPLLVVQSFVNTWEGDTGVDLFADRAAAREWLELAGLLHGGFGERELEQARLAREAIRALLVHNANGPAPDATDRQALAGLSGRCRYGLTVDADGRIELEPEAGADHLGAALLLLIRDAQRDGTWSRLKACRNPDCRWAYYDRSHAGRGAWCDMAVCGNRIKNRNLRARRTSGRTRGSGPAAS